MAHRRAWEGLEKQMRMLTMKKLRAVSIGLTGNKSGRKVRRGKTRRKAKTDDSMSTDWGGRSGNERQESR